MRRWFFTSLVAAMLPLLVIGSSAPAVAQLASREAISLQDQILELRQELQSVQAQQGGGAAAPAYARPAYPATAGSSESLAQLLTRVSALEDQMRALRGRVDELDNAVQHMGADLGKRIDDLQFQLQNPQTGPAASSLTPSPAAQSPATAGLGTLPAAPPVALAIQPPPAQPPPAQPPPTRVRPLGPRTPELALQQGYAAFARRDYTTSQQAAQEVLHKRASPRAYDAQYLLAQSLAGLHQWSRAAIAYDDTYNRSPKGGHAQEALLGLANSLTAIDEKRAACDTLTKLHGQFPHPRAVLKEQISAASQRAGCRV